MGISTLLVCFVSSMVSQGDAKISYLFRPDTDRYVKVVKGRLVFLGKLDVHGEFASISSYSANSSQSYGSLPIGIIGASGPAYELRSGILIPGEFHVDYRFVPEVGGKIIKFEDYEYSPEGRQIWNLPGRFEPVLVISPKKIP